MKSRIFIASLLFLVSCSQHHSSLTDSGPSGSLWTGQVPIQGTPQQVDFFMLRSGDSVTADAVDSSTFHINYGVTLRSKATGSFSGNSINLTLDEGPLCFNKWNVTGNVTGSIMSITLSGVGNNIVNCYDKPINQTFQLALSK